MVNFGLQTKSSRRRGWPTQNRPCAWF